MARDIDDPTKTCTYLPPDESDEDSSVAPSSPVQWRDIPDGYELRLRVYKAAWTKCLNRVQSIVRSLYASVTAEVVDQVKHAYTDAFPGLPHSEIPVIAVSAEPGSSSMYMEIIRQLDEPTSEEAASENSLSGGLARQIHLHPADCSNVLSVMKAIVMGFVEQSDDSLKRKPTASLANYDLNLLEAWYDVLGHRPKLVVFLHDFEQFDPGIVQDVFYICSMHIRRLPLVFLLALSSPLTPSYLHAAYSRSTLALLRVRIFTAPSGPAIVEQIITETFFDPNFEPDVMLGPATLDFIADFSSRHSPSLDAIFTLLQIAHLKHFEEPLTVLVHFAADTNLPPSAPRQFFDVLHARLYSGSNPRSLPECGIPGISEAIRTARLRFRQKACRMCMALCVARIVRRVAFGHPGHATKRRRPEGGVDELQFLSAALRGRASREVRYLGMIVKKLPALKLHALLRQLVEVFDSLGDPARREEEDTRIWAMGVMAQMPDSGDAIVDVSSEPEEGSEDVAGAKTSAVASLAAGVSEWFVQYLEERFVRLDEGPLWDIWYTGSTPYPSEVRAPTI
ncbi:hypothetical protein AcW1_002571 [Taiwanofungus camphoratus]|nr:hypothetical protein AcV5_009774 [Antrodia cinnamomea]KAI0942775.1 hypothetical protein AcV7_002089 [Antrodia cinnamomea]KAI0943400.1 hypothetical protein AcW1_002571 [Antrodia cinnamomea]